MNTPHNELKAFLFDVDGTLSDTERDGHRVAFNQAFEEYGLDWNWDIDTYGKLLAVTGGKERMKYYTENFMDEADIPDDIDSLIPELHQVAVKVACASSITIEHAECLLGFTHLVEHDACTGKIMVMRVAIDGDDGAEVSAPGCMDAIFRIFESDTLFCIQSHLFHRVIVDVRGRLLRRDDIAGGDDIEPADHFFAQRMCQQGGDVSWRRRRCDGQAVAPVARFPDQAFDTRAQRDSTTG